MTTSALRTLSVLFVLTCAVPASVGALAPQRGPESWPTRTVPPPLRHATASSISAPGEPCVDLQEAICSVAVDIPLPGGPASAQAPQPESPAQESLKRVDLDLNLRVQAALLPTPGDDVELVTQDGVATLSGHVPSEVERRMQVIRALGAAWPARVVDRIAVP